MDAPKQDYESVACQLRILGYSKQKRYFGQTILYVWLATRAQLPVWLTEFEVWRRELLEPKLYGRALEPEPKFYVWVPPLERWLPVASLYWGHLFREDSRNLPSPERAPVPFPEHLWGSRDG